MEYESLDVTPVRYKATATLEFVSSANPPVFKFPLPIGFSRLPNVGEVFEFFAIGYGDAHTSTVMKISYNDGKYWITTRNSTYTLIP